MKPIGSSNTKLRVICTKYKAGKPGLHAQENWG
jgi:hypothetical protein